jgi:transposase
MHKPLFVSPLTPEHRRALYAGLRSKDAFTVRRGQIVLASADGLKPGHIAERLGCSAGTARNAVRAWDAEGLACRREKSSRPASTKPVLGPERDADLRALLHQSPRTFGKPRSTWTLALLADVCHARGWTGRPLSIETIRHAIGRLGVSWKRAKHWLTSPDPAYARKKSRGTG